MISAHDAPKYNTARAAVVPTSCGTDRYFFSWVLTAADPGRDELQAAGSTYESIFAKLSKPVGMNVGHEPVRNTSNRTEK